MITKREIIRMAMVSADSMATNVYNLDYYRARIKFLDDYEPTKPTPTGKFKTDRERVKEVQKRTNFKDLRK